MPVFRASKVKCSSLSKRLSTVSEMSERRAAQLPGFKVEVGTALIIIRLRSYPSLFQAVDVFETSDLPEVDQHLLSSTELDSHDNVEILPITPNEAFGRFKGK